MKFIHIADLHLGKTLYQHNLLSLQIELLDQVLDYMLENQIQVLVMAGDIYDRSVPSKEAVEALDSFLSKAIFTHHIQILMITGNHDSSERLNFASNLLKEQGLYIVTYPKKEWEPIVIDNINFYLVPFFKPSYIRYLYPEEKIISYQDAYRVYLEHQKVDTTKANVLVTHQFVASNKTAITSESEVVLSVGGSEIIDASLFDDFDYVALGHLHASQTIKRDTVRYSGSLMKYSFDEVKQRKNMIEVTIEDKKVTCKEVPLVPSMDVQVYRGTFASFMDYKKDIKKDDYIAFELEDTMMVPNAIDRLRNQYPNVLQITYPHLIPLDTSTKTKADSGFEKMNPVELYTEFYEKMKGMPLEKASKDMIQAIIERGDEDVA